MTTGPHRALSYSLPFDAHCQQLRAERKGNSWMFRCPLHNDENPSAAIWEGEDGHRGVHCYANCDDKALWELAIKPYIVVFEPPPRDQSNRQSHNAEATFALKAHKQLEKVSLDCVCGQKVNPVFPLIPQRNSWPLIQSECGKMRTRITPNTDTFHAVVVIV